MTYPGCAAGAGLIVVLLAAGGCIAADSGGIGDRPSPRTGASSFAEAIASFTLAGDEGLIGTGGFEYRVVHGVRLHPDGTAGTWIIGGMQNGSPAWFRSAGGGWQEIRFSGPLPGERCRPRQAVSPAGLFTAHAPAVEQIFSGSDQPPVLTLASGRWELAGTGGRLVWDADTGELVGP